MSFDGDLQHLPIVDVIQLLHATRKSGTLSLKSLKGESQLVFHDGFIVSANHVDNSVRIGQVLLDMGLISYEELESALHEQQKAGNTRKPIIQTMIEAGKVHPDEAYQGLEVLIEMTIVEILSWTRGTFSLDVDRISVSDEYRYFPEQLEKEIQLNTQNVLMDALRIYDERKREGKEEGEVFRAPPELPAADEADRSAADLSAADLGLDDLETLERKIPTHFAGLGEREPDSPARRLALVLPGIAVDEQQRLVNYLDTLAKRQPAGDGTGVILCSADKVVREWVPAVCGARFLLATGDAAGVDPIIDQFHSKGRTPLLLIDAGEPNAREGVAVEETLRVLEQKRHKYPDLATALLTCPGDFEFNTRALQAGVGAVLPRSSRVERGRTFIADTIECCKALDSYLGRVRTDPGPMTGNFKQFKEQVSQLSDKREPSEVTFGLLQTVGTVFERAVTLVLVRSELVAERGIGIGAPGEVSSVKMRAPVTGESLLERAIGGETYYGDADRDLRVAIGEAIGTPASSKVLLLPVKSFGRVIAVIYGDFGARAGGEPQLELLEVLAEHAGLVIDNALYRKRCAQK